MHVFYVLGAAATLLVGALFLTDGLQFAKTAYLIARVSPYEQPGTGRGSIHIIGDSTGYGTGARHASASVAGRLGGEYPGYAVSNDSVNGRMIKGAQAAVSSLQTHYSVMVLQIGANDLLAKRPVDLVVADMERLIAAAQLHADSVVVLTAGNIGAAPRFTGAEADYFQQVSREYTHAMETMVAADPAVAFVPLFDEPENDPFVAEPEKYMAFDGLHPTGEGYGVWYEKARPYFITALNK